ncbi:MAG: hypothetical protein CSYNP_02288 [Syntrophus sp. SKADARSKE-3]|nr:hypothetical protein [Syntrophus sp. SKADARSKE-3]
MERLSKRFFPAAALALAVCLVLGGCPSLRIEKVNDGPKIKAPPQTFIVGKTTLFDVLRVYGAPADVVDMKGHFALYYQRSFYRGGQLSISIPLSDVIKVSPSFNAAGNLLRYDTAVFIFTPDGTLSAMAHAKDSDHPLWGTYWKQ